jgi:hypothetical protein
MANETNIHVINGVRCFVDPTTGEAKVLVQPVRDLVKELFIRMEAAEAEIATLKQRIDVLESGRV